MVGQCVVQCDRTNKYSSIELKLVDVLGVVCIGEGAGVNLAESKGIEGTTATNILQKRSDAERADVRGIEDISLCWLDLQSSEETIDQAKVQALRRNYMLDENFKYGHDGRCMRTEKDIADLDMSASAFGIMSNVKSPTKGSDKIEQLRKYAVILFVHAMGGSHLIRERMDWDQSAYETELNNIRAELTLYISENKSLSPESIGTRKMLRAAAELFPSVNYEKALQWNVSRVGSEKVKPFIDMLLELYKKWYPDWKGLKSHDMYTIRCLLWDILLERRNLNFSLDDFAVILYLTQGDKIDLSPLFGASISVFKNPTTRWYFKALMNAVAFIHAVNNGKVVLQDKVSKEAYEAAEWIRTHCLKYVVQVDFSYQTNNLSGLWFKPKEQAEKLSSYLEKNSIDPYPFLQSGCTLLAMMKQYNFLPDDF